MSQFRSSKTMPLGPTYFPDARDFSIDGGHFGDDRRTYEGPVQHFHGSHSAATAHSAYAKQPANTQMPSYYSQPYQAEPIRTNSLSLPSPAPIVEDEFIKSRRNQYFNNSHPQRSLGSIDDEQHVNLSYEGTPWFPPRSSAKIPTRHPHGKQINRETSIDEERRNISPELENYIRKLERQWSDQTPSTRHERDLQDRLNDYDNAQNKLKRPTKK